MKKIIVSYFLCLLAFYSLGKGNSITINDKVDWKSFLARHDLVWDRTPDDYFTAPFLGNGLLGAMFYCWNDGEFRLDIGRTDVVEHRRSDARSIVDNGRLPIGYFTLEMSEHFAGASGRLDLYNAEADFNLQTVKSKDIRLRTIVLRNFDAVLIEYELPDGLQCDWMFHPQASVVPRNPKVGSNYLNPLPEMYTVDGIEVCTQKRDAGGSYTTAWKITEVSKKQVSAVYYYSG